MAKWRSPTRVATGPTSVIVNDLPSWVPGLGQYADITTTLASSVDPCPSRTCVYSAASGFEGIWTAWNGGIFAPTLGAYGSMIFFGGGHGAYFGNEVVRFDIASRSWALMSQPALYGQGYGSWPSSGDAPPSVVGPYGSYANGTPYPFHTNMGICFLPSDAGGGSLGSYVFISHDQTGVVCENECKLWRFDFATAIADPSNAPVMWSVAPPGATSIQNFSFGNGGATRNAIAYDSNRKGVWILRYHGSGNLSFYSFLTGVETLITKTGDATWNLTSLDEPALTYHPIKDCLISRDSFNNLCVANLAGFNVAAPTSVPCKFVAYSGTPAPAYIGTPVGLYCDLLEYCDYDQNLYLLDWYSKTTAKLYKLTPPSDVINGTWAWSNETLTPKAGTTSLEIMPIGGDRQPAAAFFGRFRWVPTIKSFTWSDKHTLKAQAGRPSNFT